VRTISSRHNPVVGQFRDLAAHPDADGARVLLDGVHLVREAQRAHLSFDIVVVAASALDAHNEEGEIALELERGGATVLAADQRTIEAISPVRTPSGIAAIARRTPASAAAVCGAAHALVVAAVDVQDPGNMGSLLRAAEAGGATGALACGASATPFSWKALRGAMGSSLRLPIAAGMTIHEAVRCMKDAKLRMVAAVARGGSDPDAIDWTGRIGLLLGGEGAGLSDEVAAACDARVTIGMAAPVESLNVAVAGAILIYAARRQRAHRPT
jgi:TrmH family RNA methyltransferase